MDAADVKVLLGEIVVTLIGAALIALAAYWVGRGDGAHAEREKWQKRVLVAERAARQTETDLAGIAAKSAARIAEKERLLDERAQQLDADWRATLAGLPRCRVPARVGVQLDAAAGLPAAPTVAEPPDPDPDAAALDAVVDLADTLDRVRANYTICATNIGRLTEARTWYDEIRNRVNAGATP